ncbi:MAG TPA: ABC transporter permease [Pseudonocardiaceae bacterium]|nr:ABC transporter permease [Pseudonocardiaceae bacterium]
MTAVQEAAARPTGAARADARRRQAARRTAIVWTVRVVLVGAFVAAWQVGGSSSTYATLVFSTPAAVVQRIGQWLTDGSWWVSFGATLQEAVLGYLLGVAVALVLVAITAPSRLVTRFLAPFIAALNALPKIALAPVFILLFGTRLESKVLFIASLIGFMVFYAVSAAVQTIDRTLIANMRVLGASRTDLLRNVYGPAMLGQVIASLRVSSAWALLAAVIAEYLAANQGLGYLIAHGQQTFATADVIAGIVVVAFVAVALDRILVVVERRLSRWRPQPTE